MTGVRTWECACHRWKWVGGLSGAVGYEIDMWGAITAVQRIGDTALAEIDHPEYRPGPIRRLLDRWDRALDRKIAQRTRPKSS